MLTLTRVLVLAFVVGLTGAMMPGSMLALVVAETRRHGVWAGPLVVIGHMFLEIVVIVALLAGLGRFLAQPLFHLIISVPGGILLVVMAIGLLRSGTEQGLTEPASSVGRAGKATPILGGILTSIANPYFTIWWATVGLAMITDAVAVLPNRWLAAGAFFTGHILSDAAWYTLVSFSLAAGRRRVIPPRAYTVTIRLAAIMVKLLGIYYVYSGVRRFLGV